MFKQALRPVTRVQGLSNGLTARGRELWRSGRRRMVQSLGEGEVQCFRLQKPGSSVRN